MKGSLVRLRGLRVLTDNAACTRCGTCVKECFTGARTLSNGVIVHDDSLCKGCGRCATVCPSGAVSIEIADMEQAISEVMGRIRERVNIE